MQLECSSCIVKLRVVLTVLLAILLCLTTTSENYQINNELVLSLFYMLQGLIIKPHLGLLSLSF